MIAYLCKFVKLTKIVKPLQIGEVLLFLFVFFD